jgi:hypothetical protein
MAAGRLKMACLENTKLYSTVNIVHIWRRRMFRKSNIHLTNRSSPHIVSKSLGVLIQLRRNPYDLIRIIPAKGSG